MGEPRPKGAGGKALSTELKRESARFSSDELNSLFNANLDFKEKLSINTDSRTIKKDEIFLPLIGEKFDGHDFIESIVSNGSLAFCEKSKLSKIYKKYYGNLIVVENVLNAYHKIANYYRSKINPKVISITGSSGKTTTKEIVSAVLSAKYKTHKTEKNYNNEIGVPKTILEMPPDTEVLVLELAMRGLGEIALLSRTSNPDIAIITNVGTAHIGRLGSRENIIKAKSEILEHLKKDGIAILHNNTKLIEHTKSIWTGKTIIFDFDQITKSSYKNGVTHFSFLDEDFSINALGKVYVLDSIIAILAAKELDMKKEEIQKGLSKFYVPAGRGNVLRLGDNLFLINETYNANPDSVKEAILNLTESFDASFNKVFILGEMAELGEHENILLEDIGKTLLKADLLNVITIGENLKQVNLILGNKVKNVKNIEECCKILSGLIKPNTVISVKGSRVAGLEKVIEFLESNNK